MALNYEWSGTDAGLGETISLPSPVSIEVDAPTGDLWSTERLLLNPSLRAHFTAQPAVTEGWWAGSEVLVDAVFSDDGADFLPDVTSGDKRILFVSHLQPVITYSPTANHFSVVWQGPREGWSITTRRSSDVVPTTRRKVFIHFTALDQHGVFTNSGSSTARLFNIDASARVLWYLKT